MAHSSLAETLQTGRAQISRSPGTLSVGVRGSRAFVCTICDTHLRRLAPVQALGFLSLESSSGIRYRRRQHAMRTSTPTPFSARLTSLASVYRTRWRRARTTSLRTTSLRRATTHSCGLAIGHRARHGPPSVTTSFAGWDFGEALHHLSNSNLALSTASWSHRPPSSSTPAIRPSLMQKPHMGPDFKSLTVRDAANLAIHNDGIAAAHTFCRSVAADPRAGCFLPGLG